MPHVDDAAVKRWVAGQEAAARRALQLLREEGAPAPAVAFEQAMELCALVEVEPADEVRLRNEAATRAAWAKVRAWAASHGADA
jgi:hypothetical protein